MDDFKTKRDSKIRMTISRIAGTDRPTRRIMKSSPAGRKKRPKSLLSFLPSMLDNGSVEFPPRNSSTAAVDAIAVVLRPPPFFHSQSLPGTPVTRNNRFTDQTVDSSLSSLRSEEIARWKISKPLPNARRPHTRFGFLKSLLNLDKKQPTTPAGPGGADNAFTSTPDSSMSVEYPRQASGLPLLRDHPFASNPDFTRGPESFSRSLDINILPPPPRPRHASTGATNPLAPRNANTPVRGLPGIDPAKWAEISISAADLVREYGRDNVLFGAALEHPSDSLEEEKEVGDLSFFEMEDECGPLQSSPHTGGKILRSKSREVDRSVSMSGSITSLSKWPLPPHYEKFELTSAIP